MPSLTRLYLLNVLFIQPGLLLRCKPLERTRRLRLKTALPASPTTTLPALSALPSYSRLRSACDWLKAAMMLLHLLLPRLVHLWTVQQLRLQAATPLLLLLATQARRCGGQTRRLLQLARPVALAVSDKRPCLHCGVALHSRSRRQRLAGRSHPQARPRHQARLRRLAARRRLVRRSQY